MHLGLIVSDPAALSESSRLLRAAGAGVLPERLVSLTGDEAADRAQLDAVLNDFDGRRLVLAVDRRTLVALLHRLMRRGDLMTVETAVLSPLSSSLIAQGMPTGVAEAAQLAVSGVARAVGVLKDDSGGILVDSAELTPWREATPSPPPASFRVPSSSLRTGPSAMVPLRRQTMWMRAYVDDNKVCDGDTRRLVVTRVGRDLLRAEAEVPSWGRFGRGRKHVVEGRALQLACDEAQIVSDGVPRERPRSKRTWWCEPDLWKVALPPAP